jgi:hypothetical protein
MWIIAVFLKIECREIAFRQVFGITRIVYPAFGIDIKKQCYPILNFSTG